MYDYDLTEMYPMGFRPQYRTAIVDECGTVRAWCDDLTDEEQEEILASHEEWYIETVEEV